MKSKHTPGPWKCNPIDRAGNFALIPANAGNGTLVSTDEALANAKLIAAAPELLEALKRVIASFPYPLDDLNDFLADDAAIKYALQVVRKAESTSE